MNETNFKIEKGIPIPRRTGSGRKPKYPWAEMKKGDSFFVMRQTINRLGSCMVRAGKRLGMKFSARTEKGGVRIWRVK